MKEKQVIKVRMSLLVSLRASQVTGKILFLDLSVI